MGRKISDLIGRRFGKLVVIKRDDNKNLPSSKSVTMWECKCDCGNVITVCSHHLISGNTKSCGCLRGGVHKQNGEAALNGLYSRYKNGAIKRSLNFSINKEFFISIINKNCFYCNKVPSQTYKNIHGDKYGHQIYNGIDRIDSSKGYTKDNVVPCCGTCNIMKMALSQQEFLEHIERIHNYQKEKNNG